MDSTDLPEAVTLAAILVAGFGERDNIFGVGHNIFWRRENFLKGGRQYFLGERIENLLEERQAFWRNKWLFGRKEQYF